MRSISLLILIAIANLGSAQEAEHNYDVYEIDITKDAILLGTGALATFIGDRMLKSQPIPSLDEINSLDENSLWGIDSHAVDNYSPTAETVSDIILFTSATLPFAIYALDNCRGEELEVLFMAAETFLITNGITNVVKSAAQRYRPYNYNPDVGMDTKLKRTSNRSFFSGHASNTAAFCFLTAKGLNDMHPHWKTKKYISWIVAAALPLGISYGRYKAGKHFPTDVLTGYIFGAGVGLLIPHLHKKDNSHIQVGLNTISFSTSF